MREVAGNAENYSQDSPTVEFGLGANTVVDSVLIRWPSGRLQTLTGVGVDQRLRVLESGPTNQPPVISAQPVSRHARVGEDARLSVAAWGPDIWDLSVAGGQTLLHTTFLLYQWDPPQTQALPDDHPGGTYQARTGASENNSLGDDYADSVYRLTYTFAHAADVLVLNFSGLGLQPISDESWGLDNVRIELTPMTTASPPSQGPAHNLAVSGMSNPARPTRIGGYSTKRSLQQVAVAGRYAYVVDGDWLLILDVTDPGFPLRVGLYEVGGPVRDLHVNWRAQRTWSRRRGRMFRSPQGRT